MRQHLRKQKKQRFQIVLNEFIELDRINDARKLPMRYSKFGTNIQAGPEDFASYSEKKLSPIGRTYLDQLLRTWNRCRTLALQKYLRSLWWNSGGH